MSFSKSWLEAAGKRSIDIIVTLLGLTAAAPLMVIIAVLILIETGPPVLFRQTRLGRAARPFTLFKFRSMYQDAPRVTDDSGAAVVTEGDSRVTNVGRYLRRWNLDELPQGLNVLRGEMSLVGPRPELPEHYEMYSERERRRFLVRPGVTGLGFVMGGNSISWRRRRNYAVEYVENYSVGLDIWILVRTVSIVLRGGG